MGNMRAILSAALLFGLVALPLASSHARVSENFINLFYVMEPQEALSTLSKSSEQNCALHRDDAVVNSGFGASQLSSQEYWRRTQCSELFGESPPAWLKELDPDAFFIREWWPLCSLTDLQSARHNTPGQPLSKYIAISDMHLAFRDLCAYPGADRFSASYVTPSQDSAGLTPINKVSSSSPVTIPRAQVLSEEQKKEAEYRLESLKSKIIGPCCGGNSQCESRFSKLKFRWCQPQSDPNQPDHCIDGAFFSYSWPPFQGQIDISPLLNRDGLPQDDSFTIAHELGHSCSIARKVTLLFEEPTLSNNGHLQQETHRIPGPDETMTSACKLDDTYVEWYKKSFEALGASSETFECLLAVASKADSHRFGSQPCTRGCPRQHLEEALAEWVAYRFEARGPNSILRADTCHGNRDSWHPLDADVLRCALKTHQMRKTLQEASGCRP